MVTVTGGGYETTCGNCGSTLSFTRSDVRVGAERPHDPDRDHDSVITCPRCRRAVIVTSIVGAVSSERAAAQAREDDLYDI